MANNKKFLVKNGLQTSNISFKDSFNGNEITMTMNDSSKTLSFDGTAGQLFSISDSFGGVLFSVNDISGIPSLEIDDQGIVRLAEFSGHVIIADSSASQNTSKYPLQVTGGIYADSVNATLFGDGSNITGIPTVVFSTIAVAGQSDVVADTATDTLTLAAGSGITIATTAGTDTITFSATGGGGGAASFDSDEDTISGTTTTAINTFAVASTSTRKYIATVTNGTKLQSSEMLLIGNGTNAYLTTYAIVNTDSNLGTFTADLNSGSARLIFTPTLSGSNVVKLKFTDISV
jgi:hypothetical protein